MVASRMDVEWDRAGDWQMVVGRRTRNGVVLRAADPSVLEVRAVDAPSTTSPLISIAGMLREDGRVRMRVLKEQMAGLPAEHYEYVVVLTDETENRPYPLLRGYVTLCDTVGDRP